MNWNHTKWLRNPDIPETAYDLNMKCRVNGKQVSSGNLKDMDWTFAEIIERCAYGVDIFPGDVIGSGTVGTGCFLELNGTGLLNDPSYKAQWLKEGDVVEMEIDHLGHLEKYHCKEKIRFQYTCFEERCHSQPDPESVQITIINSNYKFHTEYFFAE